MTTTATPPPAAARNTIRVTVARHVLTVLICVAALIFVGSILFAVLAEMQSDYLAARSEIVGGFDPNVFPPFDTLTWLMALAAPVVTGLALILTITARVLLNNSHGTPAPGEQQHDL